MQIILPLLILILATHLAPPQMTTATCSFNDVAFVAPGKYTVKTYYMSYALDAWIDNVVTNVPEVYYTYYWDSQTKTLNVIFYDAGPESGYVTYTVFFKSEGACPTEPPKSLERLLVAYTAKKVDSINPVSTKPPSVTSSERILPAYKARQK
ncbi:MAG: hypothetical protein QXP31_05120 [Pyrobaculum sp.]